MLSRLAARPLSLTSTNSKTLLVCSTRFYWVLQTMGVTNKKEGGVKTLKWYAPKGLKLIAQGSALGILHPKAKRPVRAKAFIVNAFALTGRFVHNNIRLPRAFLLRQAAEPSGPGLGAIWAFSPHY